MKRMFYGLFAVIFLLGSMVPNAMAADSQITTMVNIIMHLQHYPSDQEIVELKQITVDPHATVGEKIIAGALMRMRHRVGADDAAKLQDLKNSDSASANERKLATILLGIAHHPTADDKKLLQRILKSD